MSWPTSMTYEQKIAAFRMEQAIDDYNARICDPECCQLCGNWLDNEPRSKDGRAHDACAQQAWADDIGGDQ